MGHTLSRSFPGPRSTDKDSCLSLAEEQEAEGLRGDARFVRGWTRDTEVIPALSGGPGPKQQLLSPRLCPAALPPHSNTDNWVTRTAQRVRQVMSALSRLVPGGALWLVLGRPDQEPDTEGVSET